MMNELELKSVLSAHRMSHDNMYAQNVFKNMTTNNQIFCAEHFHEIYFILRLESSKFSLDDTYMIFSKATENQKKDGKTLYDIISKYKNHESQYFFMPCVIDYSVDKGHVHQGAIIYDYKEGLVLFYEPYGKYEKYGADYSCCVLNFLAQFYKVRTWHKFFNITEGIQTILLKHNNSQASDFVNEMNECYEIFRKYDKYDAIQKTLSKEKSLSIRKDDSTYDIVSITDEIYDWDDKEIVLKVCEIYKKYNSKCCVIITLLEIMNIENLSKFYDIIKKNHNSGLYHLFLLYFIQSNMQ